MMNQKVGRQSGKFIPMKQSVNPFSGSVVTEYERNLVGVNTRSFAEYVDKTHKARKEIIARTIKKELDRRFEIHKNVCPSCNGKLTRGKRNKDNDYKREWGCINCFDIHTI